MTHFPDNFIWGAATSAYQIEGSWNEDGRGPSIWDVYSHRRGKVRGGDNGDTAIDHYHRWKEDIQLMAALGLKAYRFSISWSRVLPRGKGPINQPGLDFYSRLVDGLLEKGIVPYPTLFHYDLPLPLQESGGWTDRATAQHFADYSAVVSRSLGDRVDHFITINEPTVIAMLGHLSGEHAPGWRNPAAALSTLHHLLLSHGLAVQALRSSASRPLSIGIAINLSPVYPASPSPQDARAAQFADALINKIVLDPLLRGCYPSELSQTWLWRWLEKSISHPGGRGIRAEDLQTIAIPLDFLGINYYSRTVVRSAPLIQALPVRPPQSAYSQMWEIYPEGLGDLLLRLNNDYHHPNLIVTENGIPVEDVLTPDGQIHDHERISFLEAHIRQISRALDAGVPVSGYLTWSLLDNFEWALGYSRRFGLVYVNFETQQRIPKDSASWYARVIHQNGISAAA